MVSLVTKDDLLVAGASVVIICGLRSWNSQALEHGPSSYGTWVLFATACGILVLGQGIEPMSPALTGGFLTTGPPGKSSQF